MPNSFIRTLNALSALRNSTNCSGVAFSMAWANSSSVASGLPKSALDKADTAAPPNGQPIALPNIGATLRTTFFQSNAIFFLFMVMKWRR